MKLLFAARLARPDLVVAITRLASRLTSWNKSHDRALRRLMQYTRHAADLELVSELSSGDLLTAMLVMSPDADLAGGLESTKSTSGLWIELRNEDRKRRTARREGQDWTSMSPFARDTRLPCSSDHRRPSSFIFPKAKLTEFVYTTIDNQHPR